MTTLYGIPNCDTVKKARRWLDAQKVAYRFHDFRADGLTRAQVKAWLADLGVETLINKRSSTWKGLGSEQKAALSQASETQKESATQLLLDNPTLIKRPLLETSKQRLVGFDADTYATLFSH